MYQKNTSIIISYGKVEQRQLLFFIVAHHSWSNQNVAFSIYWTKYIQVCGIPPMYGVNCSLFYIVLLRNPSLCSIKFLPETYGSLTLEYMSGIEILNSRTQQPNRRYYFTFYNNALIIIFNYKFPFWPTVQISSDYRNTLLRVKPH